MAKSITVIKFKFQICLIIETNICWFLINFILENPISYKIIAL